MDALFTGKKSLRIHHNSDSLFAWMKNYRLYCVFEEERGYKEFIASQSKGNPKNFELSLLF
ncbi:MAG: hypothetical protein GF421_05900 [Candidatus Aminicenantes bacterium]|nr:hypothetical protein [Candidatus Aminicenantes bacterium]